MAPDVSGRLPGRFGDRWRSPTTALAAGGQPAAGRPGAQYRQRPVRTHAGRCRANAPGPRALRRDRRPDGPSGDRHGRPRRRERPRSTGHRPAGVDRGVLPGRGPPSSRRTGRLADGPLRRRRRSAPTAHPRRPRRGGDELGPRASSRRPDGRREAFRPRRRPRPPYRLGRSDRSPPSASGSPGAGGSPTATSCRSLAGSGATSSAGRSPPISGSLPPTSDRSPRRSSPAWG